MLLIMKKTKHEGEVKNDIKRLPVDSMASIKRIYTKMAERSFKEIILEKVGYLNLVQETSGALRKSTRCNTVLQKKSMILLVTYRKLYIFSCLNIKKFTFYQIVGLVNILLP